MKTTRTPMGTLKVTQKAQGESIFTISAADIYPALIGRVDLATLAEDGGRFLVRVDTGDSATCELVFKATRNKHMLTCENVAGVTLTTQAWSPRLRQPECGRKGGWSKKLECEQLPKDPKPVELKVLDCAVVRARWF